jgi:salicylate hydroxylase
MAIEDAVCLAELLDDTSAPEVQSAFSQYVNARYLRTARVQYESRYSWDNWYHVGGLEREVMRATWEQKSEQDMFDCVAWLYDGFQLPKKRKAA